MRKAETILNIIRERGQRNLPVKNVYRLLYQRDLYLRAYGKLCRNKGAMTEGVTVETVDGMSLEKIDKIIEGLRYERYRWTPVKRIYVLKKSGKRRPLGLPTWSNKLLQEVIRLILEAYYEPKFSTWISTKAWMPHCIKSSNAKRQRYKMVYRGRSQCML